MSPMVINARLLLFVIPTLITWRYDVSFAWGTLQLPPAFQYDLVTNHTIHHRPS